MHVCFLFLVLFLFATFRGEIKISNFWRTECSQFGPSQIVRDDDDDEIAYFTVRWKTRASFVYRTKNVDNNGVVAMQIA